MSIVVNLTGGPGVGKSTLAALLLYELRVLGYNAEPVSEYPKKASWEKNLSKTAYQPVIFANQAYQQNLLRGQTDIMISDSPLLLSLVYNADRTTDTFKKFVLEEFKSYQNLTYYIVRDDSQSFQQSGRIHDSIQSQVLDRVILETMEQYHIPFKRIDNSRESIQTIIEDIKVLGR